MCEDRSCDSCQAFRKLFRRCSCLQILESMMGELSSTQCNEMNWEQLFDIFLIHALWCVFMWVWIWEDFQKRNLASMISRRVLGYSICTLQFWLEIICWLLEVAGDNLIIQRSVIDDDYTFLIASSYAETFHGMTLSSTGPCPCTKKTWSCEQWWALTVRSRLAG